MSTSVQPGQRADVQYLLRIGDACLVLSHRISEWIGHSPVLEEDLALGNIALDLLGQARALLTRAGQLNEEPLDEDQLAYLREERHYLNPVLMELPRGDFAFTQARNLIAACWLLPLWTRLQASSDAEVAAIAAKAVKEVRYHQQHAAEWVVRLGDGSEESTRRMTAALTALWPYVNELFASDAVDAAAEASDLGPAWSSLKPDWDAAMDYSTAKSTESSYHQQDSWKSEGIADFLQKRYRPGLGGHESVAGTKLVL